ncbi:hypothetical protein FV194_14755 [Pseudomonas aeruginosa]|nr:hypothetical protein CDG41_14315 [Pseudomonas aeruginosa]EYU05227.1 hypothetical protein PA103_3724 [Pseudomonas aeruginosa PA103]OWK91282.1 hypothetical protein L999_028845 [Pseudomonas aeruginosa 148]ASD03712.1 hypothetical protein CD797_14635 [Pseudomonas aeruginosa]AUA71105.1 hypothetical protein CWI25_14175 [Pseudomonas aeruginosa]
MRGHHAPHPPANRLRRANSRPAAIRRTQAQASADNAAGVIRPTQAPTCFRRTASPSCGRQATRVRFPVPAARR